VRRRKATDNRRRRLSRLGETQRETRQVVIAAPARPKALRKSPRARPPKTAELHAEVDNELRGKLGSFALLNRIWNRLKDWYEGDFVPYKDDPGSPISRIGGYSKRPWLARAIDALGRFYQKHWQWLIATILAIIGIVVAIMSK
jgi:hypothetical protein